jgi:ABC-type proline/glycine betaine transport system permease subunit
MTIAAVGHAASHGAATQVIPQGKSDHEQQILLLLVLATVIVFIQHDASGKAQDGTQYAALGIVGFFLLVLTQFWPSVALTLTILFVISIILNSPNGVPLVSKVASSTSPASTVAPLPSSGPNQPATPSDPVRIVSPLTPVKEQ